MAHLVALAGAGLSASELTQIGLKAGGGLLALACALAVLAALTPDKSLFALGCLVALGSWGGIRWIVLAVFRHRWGAELGEHLFVSWLAFVLLMLAITMSLCLVFLYRGQARGRALGLTGLFLLIVMVVVVVWTGGLFWLGPGHPSPPSIQLHPPSQTLDLSTPEGTLRVEPEIGYRPNKTFYRLLHTQVRLDGIDGSSWNLTQIHEKGSTEGPTLGFYPAMKEALTDVPAAVKFADLVILEPPRAAASHLRLLTEDTFLLGKPPLKVRVQGRSLVEERQLRWLGVLSAAGSSRIQERELWAQLSSAPSSSTPQIVAQSLHSGNEKCQPVFLLLKPGGEPQERIDVESELVQNTAHNLPLPLPYPSIIRKSLSLAPPGSLPARNLQFGVIESCAVARRLARLTDQAYTIRPTP
ncbi:MAG: hypothetical protein SX243_13685 [Acidobacteriota bacterium]|nr:hypothetical protein [Acidobacteriota bacterium]